MNEPIELRLGSNSTLYRRRLRREMRCFFCPPNKGENATRRAHHGARKKRKGWR